MAEALELSASFLLAVVVMVIGILHRIGDGCDFLACSVESLCQRGRIYTLFTYPFISPTLVHVLLGSGVLLIFGVRVERICGPRAFLMRLAGVTVVTAVVYTIWAFILQSLDGWRGSFDLSLNGAWPLIFGTLVQYCGQAGLAAPVVDRVRWKWLHAAHLPLLAFGASVVLAVVWTISFAEDGNRAAPLTRMMCPALLSVWMSWFLGRFVTHDVCFPFASLVFPRAARRLVQEIGDAAYRLFQGPLSALEATDSAVLPSPVHAVRQRTVETAAAATKTAVDPQGNERDSDEAARLRAIAVAALQARLQRQLQEGGAP